MNNGPNSVASLPPASIRRSRPFLSDVDEKLWFILALMRDINMARTSTAGERMPAGNHVSVLFSQDSRRFCTLTIRPPFNPFVLATDDGSHLVMRRYEQAIKEALESLSQPPSPMIERDYTATWLYVRVTFCDPSWRLQKAQLLAHHIVRAIDAVTGP